MRRRPKLKNDEKSEVSLLCYEITPLLRLKLLKQSGVVIGCATPQRTADRPADNARPALPLGPVHLSEVCPLCRNPQAKAEAPWGVWGLGPWTAPWVELGHEPGVCAPQPSTFCALPARRVPAAAALPPCLSLCLDTRGTRERGVY